LLGIPIRISPWFWLGSAVLGWGFAQGIAGSRTGLTVGTALILWIMIVLVSILAHEFGHAMAFRYYGIHSHIVLYQFGGLAVPHSTFGFAQRMRLSSREQIVVSAAGPAASLAVGIAVAAIFYAGGFAIPNPIPFLSQLDFLEHGARFPAPIVRATVYAILF